ncbi:DUF1653 domain-containing protein [Streptococcus agalactiae]|uniref:DUF1653 domain-containing protein n=1 Tax=Streptococcus agalactiae TaxID=1311 RepID=UPI0008671BA5|nr:DUF1653 domain-containing protein [Streptococcus agalactiae]MBY5043781.1 DUF1653 domain-containing protein [Streptococcus agalactiae]MBY5047242.1 DUF1653 domain-containing protein [Streptococcus agalactiae]MBY5057571.1 DUF1653 domain-containing protein [Streptococcus agalactiae]ODG95458.1 hypothetical protein TH70_0263 [Streptococcus agalactiae]
MIGDLYKDNETGDIYHVMCHGKLEHNLKPVVIYQDLEDEVWVRPLKEFYDGRFEKVEE